MKILIVDETEVVARQLTERLNVVPAETTGSYHMDVVFEFHYERAIDTLKTGRPFDVVVVEPYPLEQSSRLGLKVIKWTQRSGAVPIVLTSTWRTDWFVLYMRAGAWDVIMKARPMAELVTMLINSILKARRKRIVPDRDAEWISANLRELCRRYPGQWIAVSAAEELIVNADTHEELMRKMENLPSNLNPRVWLLPVSWMKNEPDF
jgi:DNA-binding response OmpR family regulator